MRINGGEGRSDPIKCGGVREEEEWGVQRPPVDDICQMAKARNSKPKRRTTNQQEKTQTKGK